MNENLITISELAKMFQINHHTIRYYEKQKLLFPFEISENGYRKYGMSEVYKLSFILFFKNFGLSLAEIKHLMQDENAKEYLNILQKKKIELQQEKAHLSRLIKIIDSHIETNIKSSKSFFTVDHTVYLTKIERLPIEKAFDISSFKNIEWNFDIMMDKIYYVIYDTHYDICIESKEITDFKIESGKYQIKFIDSGGLADFDYYIKKIKLEQLLPIIIIEDGSRILTLGKHIVLKILGEKDY